MAHHAEQPTAIESVLDVLSEHGLGAMAEAMQTLLNEAMKLERSEFLRAAPGDLTTWLRGTFHGVSPKHLQHDLDEFSDRFDRRWREGELFGFVLRRVAGGQPLPYRRLVAEGTA